jgi:hypothetical protein
MNEISVRLRERYLSIAISAASALIYYFSNPRPQEYYDYTFRVAGRFLHGALGLNEQPPGWLNEFVPLGDSFYSVFPLGAVLTMIPAALLQAAGLVTVMPGALLGALCAGVSCYLLMAIAGRYDVEPTRRIVMTAGMIFGTWMWTNLTFAGAGQHALGFAVVGELGAIYFTV